MLPVQTPKPKKRRRLLIVLVVAGVLVTSFPFVVVGGLLAQTNFKQWQHCRGYTQFSEWLVIELDAAGYVNNAKLVTD
ncbi:MAG: hypothetical protein WBG38_17065 [Nodosilinea sp.]